MDRAIRITAKAAAKIDEVRRAEGLEDVMELRLLVRFGGKDPGFEYLVYSDTPAPSDYRLEINGVRIVMDTASLDALAGSELDYLETPNGAGFKFNNPNEPRLRERTRPAPARSTKVRERS